MPSLSQCSSDEAFNIKVTCLARAKLRRISRLWIRSAFSWAQSSLRRREEVQPTQQILSQSSPRRFRTSWRKEGLWDDINIALSRHLSSACHVL